MSYTANLPGCNLLQKPHIFFIGRLLVKSCNSSDCIFISWVLGATPSEKQFLLVEGIIESSLAASQQKKNNSNFNISLKQDKAVSLGWQLKHMSSQALYQVTMTLRFSLKYDRGKV